jgi:hypothetical protein
LSSSPSTRRETSGAPVRLRSQGAAEEHLLEPDVVVVVVAVVLQVQVPDTSRRGALLPDKVYADKSSVAPLHSEPAARSR